MPAHFPLKGRTMRHSQSWQMLHLEHIPCRLIPKALVAKQLYFLPLGLWSIHLKHVLLPCLFLTRGQLGAYIMQKAFLCAAKGSTTSYACQGASKARKMGNCELKDSRPNGTEVARSQARCVIKRHICWLISIASSHATIWHWAHCWSLLGLAAAHQTTQPDLAVGSPTPTNHQPPPH